MHSTRLYFVKPKVHANAFKRASCLLAASSRHQLFSLSIMHAGCVTNSCRPTPAGAAVRHVSNALDPVKSAAASSVTSCNQASLEGPLDAVSICMLHMRSHRWAARWVATAAPCQAMLLCKERPYHCKHCMLPSEGQGRTLHEMLISNLQHTSMHRSSASPSFNHTGGCFDSTAHNSN